MWIIFICLCNGPWHIKAKKPKHLGNSLPSWAIVHLGEYKWRASHIHFNSCILNQDFLIAHSRQYQSNLCWLVSVKKEEKKVVIFLLFRKLCFSYCPVKKNQTGADLFEELAFKCFVQINFFQDNLKNKIAAFSAHLAVSAQGEVSGPQIGKHRMHFLLWFVPMIKVKQKTWKKSKHKQIRLQTGGCAQCSFSIITALIGTFAAVCTYLPWHRAHRHSQLDWRGVIKVVASSSWSKTC